jgi:hypothetical protein
MVLSEDGRLKEAEGDQGSAKAEFRKRMRMNSIATTLYRPAD